MNGKRPNSGGEGRKGRIGRAIVIVRKNTDYTNYTTFLYSVLFYKKPSLHYIYITHYARLSRSIE